MKKTNKELGKKVWKKSSKGPVMKVSKQAAGNNARKYACNVARK